MGKGDLFAVCNLFLSEDRGLDFLTWELPIENEPVAHALRIAFDIDPSNTLRMDDGQIWLNGARASVCPDSGRWCPAD